MVRLFVLVFTLLHNHVRTSEKIFVPNIFEYIRDTLTCFMMFRYEFSHMVCYSRATLIVARAHNLS